jgi:spore coat polysaccharide biosynthesis protein SpsF
MNNNLTEQEKFWTGEFGEDYIHRNQGDKFIASNASMFSKIINSTGRISSIVEFGCNIGLNLQALSMLLPDCKLSGVEINGKAAEYVRDSLGIDVINESIIHFKEKNKFDLTFTMGVLIHINPDYLSNVYSRLYDLSKKYIMVAEYYNPTPVSINYRGHTDKLFKRDFAGEIMDMYPNLKLVDYGFIYHRDDAFPQDDITWFLMEKML